MSLNWPGTLPTSAAFNSIAPGLINTTRRTPVDQGPAKVRQRFAAGSKVDAFTIYCTATQWTALATFYEATTNGGALQFTMFDPTGGADREVRFFAPPVPTAIGFDIYAVALQIEVLP